MTIEPSACAAQVPDIAPGVIPFEKFEYFCWRLNESHNFAKDLLHGARVASGIALIERIVPFAFGSRLDSQRRVRP